MAKKKKAIPNVDVLMFNPINKTLSAQKVYEVYGNKVETEFDILDTNNAERYIDETNGLISYVFNLDLPAKVESENLKNLRRSVTMTRIFDYDLKKPLDIFQLMPYLIIIALVVFK